MTRRNFRVHWKLAVTFCAAFLLVFTGYSAWIYSPAMSVERLLDDAEALDIPAITSGDEAALSAATELIDRSDDGISALSSRLGPLRVAAFTFGWVPWVGDQLHAPGLLTERAEVDMIAARRLVLAAGDLFKVQEIITSDDFLQSPGSDELEQVIASLEVIAADSEAEFEAIRSTARKMEGNSLIWFLKSRATRISLLETKLTDSGDLLAAAAPALETAAKAGESALELLSMLEAPQGNLDFEAIMSTLRKLESDSNTAAVNLTNFQTALEKTVPESEIALLVSDLRLGFEAFADLSAGLGTIGTSIETATESIRGSSAAVLSNGVGLKAALSLLISEQDSLRDATEKATLALSSLDQLIKSDQANFLSATAVDSINNGASLLVHAGDLVVGGPELLLDLIAPDSVRTYLVLGQSSDELRAAGGFTSSAWSLKFVDGALVSTEFIPIVEFDIAGRSSSPLPLAPEPLAYYMDASALYLRDVGWDPDFATVGKLASSLYRLNQHGDIDGVFAINQWAIIRLIEAVGGIEFEGIMISPEQTLALIENGTDRDGTEFLQSLFINLLSSIRGDTDIIRQIELLRAFNESLRRKDILAFSNDSNEQEKIEALGWGGRFPVDNRDRIGVVDSNVGWSKSDRSIQRETRYSVDLSHPDSPKARLDLSYTHTGAENGRTCKEHSPPPPEYFPYSVSKNACYWNFLRAFVAVGAEPTSSSELPLPANSVPDLRERQKPGTPTFSHQFDANGDYFSGLVQTAAGDRSQVSINYDLPASVVGRTDDGLSYNLAIVAQSGVRSRTVIVKVTIPPGHLLVSSNYSPVSVSDRQLTFEFDLVADVLLELRTHLS